MSKFTTFFSFSSPTASAIPVFLQVPEDGCDRTFLITSPGAEVTIAIHTVLFLVLLENAFNTCLFQVPTNLYDANL